MMRFRAGAGHILFPSHPLMGRKFSCQRGKMVGWLQNCSPGTEGFNLQSDECALASANEIHCFFMFYCLGVFWIEVKHNHMFQECFQLKSESCSALQLTIFRLSFNLCLSFWSCICHLLVVPELHYEKICQICRNKHP